MVPPELALALVTFALGQPALLAETRGAANALAARLAANAPDGSIAKPLDFASAASAALTCLGVR
jgi:hypothetical protein